MTEGLINHTKQIKAAKTHSIRSLENYYEGEKFNLVILAVGKHPAPSRTRQLSPPALMVLEGRPSGRVGHCQVDLLPFIMKKESRYILVYTSALFFLRNT